MYGEKPEICIIDSGVNEDALQVGGISTNMEVTRVLQIRRRTQYDSHAINHATVCAAIIRKYAADAVLHSMKILNGRERSTIEQLRAAVLWCLDNNIKIIHMSIGSIIYSDFNEIRKLADMAWMHGTIIVAACSNNNKVTYPAALDSVIGVRCDRDKRLKEGEYIYNGVTFDGVEITACSRHSLTMHGGEKFETVCTNSYAAPFITALVYNILRDNPGISLTGIREELRRIGIKGDGCLYNSCYARYTDWVKSSLVIDFNGDGIFFNDVKIPFGIVKVVEADSNDVMVDIGELLDKIDTIIILPPDCRSGLYEEGSIKLFGEVGRLNKNIVYLGEDDAGIIECRRSEYDVRLWHPSIYRDFDYKHYLRREIEVPVIMLCAPSKHLMISLQQKLINRFLNDCYHAIGISDTPFGTIVGMEYLCTKCDSMMYKDILQAFYSLYDPDVMVVGISGKDKFEIAAYAIKPDIKIIAIDDNEADAKELLSVPADEDSMLILVKKGEDQSVSMREKNVMIINYIAEGDIDTVYKCILAILGICDESTE